MTTAVAEVETEVAEAEPTLDELAATANREYQLGLDAAVTALEHMMTAGDALLAAKTAFERALVHERERDGRISSRWSDWIDANWDSGASQASRCLRFAKYRAEIEAAGVTVIDQATTLLAGKPAAVSGRGRKIYSDAVKSAGLTMLEDGVPVREVSARLGVSTGALYRWTQPERRVERSRRRRECYSKQQEAKREAEAKAAARAMAKRGGDTAKAWSMVQQLTQVLDRARQEADDPADKETWKEAERLAHKMDALIKRAFV